MSVRIIQGHLPVLLNFVLLTIWEVSKIAGLQKYVKPALSFPKVACPKEISFRTMWYATLCY